MRVRGQADRRQRPAPGRVRALRLEARADHHPAQLAATLPGVWIHVGVVPAALADKLPGDVRDDEAETAEDEAPKLYGLTSAGEHPLRKQTQ